MPDREMQNRANEKWAYLPAIPHGRNRKLAVFIHGFGGGYLDTWGNLGELLSERADQRSPFSGWDYLFIGYSTFDIKSYLQISERISTELAIAVTGGAPYTSSYENFALLGHSLGTLGIRQFLCDSVAHSQNDLLGKVQSITLFGSPLAGSALARFVPLAIAQALTPQGAQLMMLRRWVTCAHKYEPWPEVKLVMGQSDWVVGNTDPYFVDWTNDSKHPEVISQGHVEMVKLKKWGQSRFFDILERTLS